MTTPMMTYAGALLISSLLSFVVTPLAIRFAQRRRLVDHPNPRKVHSAAIPRVGGIVIVLATVGAAAFLLVLRSVVGAALHGVQSELLVILTAGALIAAVGLVDDVRGLRARYKLLAQILLACGVCAFGIRIEAIAVHGVFIFDPGWIAWPLTVFWIVGITNAVNLIDGLDGLCAGICSAACAVIGIFAIHTDQAVMAVLMSALLGSLLGFLYYNFNPARIFMGDCGTYFLGFTIATTSVLCATKSSTIVGLALPALALGVPIFDTFFSILRRFLERRSIFSPDRSHIHHRLIDMGLRQRHVVLFLYVVTLLAAGLGLFMMVTRDARQLVILLSALLLLLVVFRAAGSVTLHDTIAGIRRRLADDRANHERRRAFEDAQLRLNLAKTFDHWWSAFCTAAERLHLASLTITITGPDGAPRTLTWTHPKLPHDSGSAISATFPVPGHRNGYAIEARLEATLSGSLEATTQKLTYFARLFDEHRLAALPSPAAPGQGQESSPA